MNSLLEIQGIAKSYGTGERRREVLSGVDLTLGSGEALGLVGETGCGKSTLAKIITGMEEADRGEISFQGRALNRLSRRSFAECAAIQYIFQDPYAALDGESRVSEVLAEPVRILRRHGFREYLHPERALAEVGLGVWEEWRERRVHTLSGGQRQRLCIARALIPRPRLLIADECTSMLDLDTGLEIAGVLKRLSHEQGVVLMVISHQLEIISRLCDTVCVMREGRIVERNSVLNVLHEARDPYARELTQAMRFFSKNNRKKV